MLRKADYEINEKTRGPLVEWLKERSQFSIWFTSLITASFMVLSVFGNKPGFANKAEMTLTTSLALLLFSLICNFVSVWAIPGRKFRVLTERVTNSRRLYLELSLNTWLGVISFVAGLTLGFISNIILGITLQAP